MAPPASLIIGSIISGLSIPAIIFNEYYYRDTTYEALYSNKINKNIKLTDISNNIEVQGSTIENISVLNNIINTNFSLSEETKLNLITPKLLNDNNNNLYISISKKQIVKDSIDDIELISNKYSIGIITIEGKNMDPDNYIYLAKQNKVSFYKINDISNNNIYYEINIYSIPKNKNIIRVEGINDYMKYLDKKVYDYEFGPAKLIMENIKYKTYKVNKTAKNVGRIITFFLLFIGLTLLIFPIKSLLNEYTNILNSFGLPINDILNGLGLPINNILKYSYYSISLILSILLTILLTMIISFFINNTAIALIFMGLFMGIILYLKNKFFS